MVETKKVPKHEKVVNETGEKSKVTIMCPAPWNSDPHLDLNESQQNLKTIPMRPSPIIHPGVDAPICPECQALEMTFFNPECRGCQSELRKMADHGIGIASIMAVLRQWIPQVSDCVLLRNDDLFAIIRS